MIEEEMEPACLRGKSSLTHLHEHVKDLKYSSWMKPLHQ